MDLKKRNSNYCFVKKKRNNFARERKTQVKNGKKKNIFSVQPVNYGGTLIGGRANVLTIALHTHGR